MNKQWWTVCSFYGEFNVVRLIDAMRQLALEKLLFTLEYVC